MSKSKVVIPKFPPFVDVLGTPWKIEIRKYSDDVYFEKNRCDGYCSEPEKLIAICDMTSWPSYNSNTYDQECISNFMKRVLRHELTHAFFAESGLADSANTYHDAWTGNEEMIDWIARQGPKLYKAWEETGCLTPMSPERYMEWKAGKEK